MVRVALSIPSPWHMLGCGLTLTRRGCLTVARVRRRTLCGKSSSLHCVVGLAKCAAILHAGKQSHSQRRSVVLTEEGDVSYWAHCVSILRFLRKGKLSREEAKVWEGRNNGADGSEAVCARWQCDYAPRPSHTHISSPSHTLPSSLESFPSPKICKMRNSQHQQCQYWGWW